MNADPGLAPLAAETIQHLHSSLRALPRPLLESLTWAFRKRFQVPDAAVTIADRISQKCHHDWIEAFLVWNDGERAGFQFERIIRQDDFIKLIKTLQPNPRLRASR